MQSDEVRRGYTSRGPFVFSPYPKDTSGYGCLQILSRNNLISKLEVVSLLNISNQARLSYHYNYANCFEKYNPKVYLGAIQSVAYEWNYDGQNPEKTDPKWAAGTQQKSGSWLQFKCQ